MITFDGFEDKTRPLVEVQPSLIIFFFVYVMCFTFGLLNMLVGQVVEKTLAESRKLELQQFTSTHTMKVGSLHEAFDFFDTDCDGKITRTEFVTQVANSDTARLRLQGIGLPLSD